MAAHEFKDHFSAIAAGYARFRPSYPDALFAWLAGVVPAREAAWDCATGNGQAARGLAAHFKRVTATDASAEQIAAAGPHPRIDYGVAGAESSGLSAESVDLITVAQAARWFDLTAFYAEAQRVLRPGGVIALWCYGLCVFGNEDLDAHLRSFYADTVGGFWPPERQTVEDGYRSLPFPFEEVAPPRLSMETKMSLEAFGAYLRTWSAVQRFQALHRRDPVAVWEREARVAWGSGARRVIWPLGFLVGRWNPA